MITTSDGSRIVDGATRLYCIIGDPVAQTGSPRVFSERFRAAGRNAILVPFHVPAAAFEPTVRGIMGLANLGGIMMPGTPDDFGKFMVAETDKWAKVIQEAQIKLE